MGMPIRRGVTAGQHGRFASRFVRDRMAGFEKDIRICLTPAAARGRTGATHAYFPALGTCCGTLEYLAGLYRGNLRGLGAQHLAEWSGRYLRQPDYNDEAIRVLFDGFRHPVAHRGVASGVWIDRRPGPTNGDRLTWKLLAGSRRPALQVMPEAGQLQRDPPWACTYTHRLHIYLRSLAVDIRRGAAAYARDLEHDAQLQTHFMRCMEQLYP